MESYAEYKERLQDERAGETKDDYAQEVDRGTAIDLDNLPEVKHNWVRRGIKVNCEGAGHPYHGHFLHSKRSSS